MAARPTVRDLFGRPGYVREPNGARRAAERARYKKGWEVRLIARDEDEVHAIERLAASLSYPPGAPFKKGQQYVVPIYGQQAVRAFRRVREQGATHEAQSSPPVPARGPMA